jgi:hypothetical protein
LPAASGGAAGLAALAGCGVTSWPYVASGALPSCCLAPTASAAKGSAAACAPVGCGCACCCSSPSSRPVVLSSDSSARSARPCAGGWGGCGNNRRAAARRRTRGAGECGATHACACTAPHRTSRATHAPLRTHDPATTQLLSSPGPAPQKSAPAGRVAPT